MDGQPTSFKASNMSIVSQAAMPQPRKDSHHPGRHGTPIRPWVRCLLSIVVLFFAWAGNAQSASTSPQDITSQARYWIDTTGQATIESVSAQGTDTFEPLGKPRAFKLQGAVLWLLLDLPKLESGERMYLTLEASAFTDRVDLYQASPEGGWKRQQAGDHIPVAQWSLEDRAPTFALDDSATPGPVWLRMENRPTPLSARVYLISESELQKSRHWAYLMIGGYLGFGLLVMFLGWVHARLYADRAFVAYVVYVACMLGFQVSFTGLGGLFFWSEWAWWNNAAPALFMLWLTASGIWFVREVCAISRHHRGVDRVVVGWSVFGLLFSLVYTLNSTELAFAVLSLYGLLSVILSMVLCFWAWRQGERYAGWLFLGFLPVHLAYPFPALRSAGLLPDSWATQYAVLIGSAIEIPLLLYILHRRAKHFNENRTRMRALDSTDPLTGLTVTPVLRLRLRDAIKRARRYGHRCAVLMVELANHSEFVALDGREAGDRALVIAAAKLSRVVRDVDTVCRVADTRFAILVEGPMRSDQIKLLAQHMVAKGLEQTSTLPGETSLRFRVVSAMPPMNPGTQEEAEELESSQEGEERSVLRHLSKKLDELASDPRKMVLHLEQQL